MRRDELMKPDIFSELLLAGLARFGNGPLPSNDAVAFLLPPLEQSRTSKKFLQTGVITSLRGSWIASAVLCAIS